MSLKEIEVLARELSADQRMLLAKRWLAEGAGGSDLEQDAGHPANGVGARELAETPIEEDPLWELGRSPVDIGLTDASVAHDRYLYGSTDD